MVSIMYMFFVVMSVSVFVSSNPASSRQSKYPRSFNDARLFTLNALEDTNTKTTDQWKAVNLHGRTSRIQATPEKCNAYVQGLTDAVTGELMWDLHRCTVLTLVYNCNARVRLLSRSGDVVLANGNDNKELSLEILVDDGRRRIIPLDGMASRELAMLLVTNQQQGGDLKHPDFHIKRQQILGPDFNDEIPKKSGFDECD